MKPYIHEAIALIHRLCERARLLRKLRFVMYYEKKVFDAVYSFSKEKNSAVPALVFGVGRDGTPTAQGGFVASGDNFIEDSPHESGGLVFRLQYQYNAEGVSSNELPDLCHVCRSNTLFCLISPAISNVVSNICNFLV